MLKLVNIKETYEVKYSMNGVNEDDQPIFVLRKLSAGEVNSIDDEITVSRGDDTFAYLGGTASKMKIRIALVDWRNVVSDDGKPVACNDSTKNLLPSDVQQFIIKRIDDDNGLRKTKNREGLEKN